MNTKSPHHVLEHFYDVAKSTHEVPQVKSAAVLRRIEYIVSCLENRACVRLLMSCMLGKIDRPHVDPREPYTKIGGSSSFSGRSYDEQYITPFINKCSLPCNSTTAFLTPALRNIDKPLTTDVALVGRPHRVYRNTLKLLEDVARGRETAENVLADTIRLLCSMRDERKKRIETLVSEVGKGRKGAPLSSEEIITLISQHLAHKNTSRLPVLLVAAAYTAAKNKIDVKVGELLPHNAADKQTAALGDVQICLTSDDRMITVYEVKQRQVSIDDIDLAVSKIAAHSPQIDNYIFVTTEAVEKQVVAHARNMYKQLDGVEIAVLDCIGFLQHFLHFFHRLRGKFLDAYQTLVLTESESAVSHPLKEAFLSLRQTAESDR
ncbi:MAG: restriction endonuclease, SacI family [Pseudomonadota bacterium]|nr:restriction endonuclease, SacI family [Pseudomonadota bacterium]